ncbi:MAG: hypothetical protein HKN38_09730 [Altererythrobacter sp.]|nr:hypothetical protein [Altererythrobacter sp.]
MDIYTSLFLIGAILIGPIMISIIVWRQQVGSPVVASTLALTFGAFTVFTIAREGIEQAILNHTANFWGTQVWYDLIIATSIALFLIAPRARATGMKLWPWAIFVALTASIGLLAMIARLFWLEQQSEQES